MSRLSWYHGRLSPRTNLLLIGLVGLGACEPKHLELWPGRSSVAVTAVESRAPAQPQAARWREYSTIERLALVNHDALPTNNHAPFEWNLRVRITPAALSLYEHWYVGAVMPVGTWIVAEHERRAGGAHGPYYFANKTDAGWAFGAATPDGLLLPEDPACARCHAEAPADFMFGLPLARAARLQIDQRPDGG
jgi:hypothetical protein